jgi:acyl-CoA thioesterase-1
MRRSLFLLLFVSFAAAAAPAPRLLVLGDSLSSAHHIAIESGWVALLEARLREKEAKAAPDVVNASISGETTSGGIARLPALLGEYRPRWLVLELGANDALRGLPLAEIHANLQSLVRQAREKKVEVLLVGIEIPINYGPQYRDGLRNVYRDVAAEFNVPLVPFLLEGVAQDESLLQDDGLHPRAEAEPRVLDNVWPQLAPMLKLKP